MLLHGPQPSDDAIEWAHQIYQFPRLHRSTGNSRGKIYCVREWSPPSLVHHDSQWLIPGRDRLYSSASQHMAIHPRSPGDWHEHFSNGKIMERPTLNTIFDLPLPQGSFSIKAECDFALSLFQVIVWTPVAELAVLSAKKRVTVAALLMGAFRVNEDLRDRVPTAIIILREVQWIQGAKPQFVHGTWRLISLYMFVNWRLNSPSPG